MTAALALSEHSSVALGRRAPPGDAVDCAAGELDVGESDEHDVCTIAGDRDGRGGSNWGGANRESRSSVPFAA